LSEAGVAKAQAELGDGYDLQFRYPAQGTAALQNSLMDDLVAAGTDAIMISSVDPKTSIDAFNRIAAQIPLFTTDSDAPQSNRIAYLGSSNTLAGEQAGGEMVKAMNGAEGKCMGFVGFLDADNAKERIAGFKTAIEGKNITLVDVRGDDVDFARARSNVDDVLAANPDINCMVGFYSYNPPKIYEALQAAGKLGAITVVAFDEDPITLGAVKEGSFASTVVQQPFEWGYQGMLLMAAYLKGDMSGVPADGLIIVPTKVIDKANVDQFEADLKAALGN
ncbi:MAG: sugar-binding protein, partial [Deltaproteobacteria bacterium]